ncbi:hypothetical protein WK57_16940 [Burkholderia ubonensis]|uniref:Uncharacterized protein n=1 Tax=Burkholderia ubonensis TaxID=101571 RepID=A0A119IU97_9BURK|nr:putative DNA-binding domain-containing protein [Burkholderia ubonensis]KWA86264.1 hypothetical protein WL29_11000 [Burkholderia ubonensis]KWB92032.1 hypothetical protein WL43_02615 [Burkholderia ubonensis]KWZ58767.1 hypothetical protein WK57_16940 [Burkholderia ubonensis]
MRTLPELMGRAPDLAFLRYQREFTGSIRRQHAASPPTGVPAERLTLYRELMLNNVCGFLDAGFPVLQQMLGQEPWRALCLAFFEEHRGATPYFHRIAQEFVQWLFQEGRQRLADEPDWLSFLAHYEVLELVVHTYPDEVAKPFLPGFALNPTLHLVCYPYAVHRICPDIQPVTVQTTRLMVWRGANDCVRFAETNLVTYSLLGLLQTSSGSLTNALEQLARATGVCFNTEQLQHLLEDLTEQSIVLVSDGA